MMGEKLTVQNYKKDGMVQVEESGRGDLSFYCTGAGVCWGKRIKLLGEEKSCGGIRGGIYLCTVQVLT